MAGQAGWYRAPGEEGLLRFWNGVTWTDHRQPDPASSPVPDALALAEPKPKPEPDPMAEYERQFSLPSLTDSALDAPLYRPRATQPRSVFAPTPAAELVGQPTASPPSLLLGAVGHGAEAPTPAATAPATEFDRMFDELSLITRTPVLPVAEPRHAAAGQAVPEYPVAAVSAPNKRRTVLGTVRVMGGGIVIILLGIATMVFFSLQSSPGTGEAETNAIVTSLGATSSNGCTPIARFAVAGKSYTTNSSAPISPCSIGLGESVSVVYSVADPASAARIDIGSALTAYLWLVPILGGLVFLIGFIAFIVSAGSMVTGIALLREGRARPTKHASIA